MKAVLVVLMLAGVGLTVADITGTDPPNGACLCFVYDAVNIRNSPCGAVIGMVSSGSCYTYTGAKQGCTMDFTYYEFFRFDYSGTEAWAAGDFMIKQSDSPCATPTEGYSCNIAYEGWRIHETTSPTPYDCTDTSCGNTCMGGQCVAYVTCECKRNGQWPPGTQCWAPGTKVKGSDGKCNRAIPVGTAIATFDSSGAYYAGHAAVFAGCQDDYTILAWDQWCCSSIGYSTYPSSNSYFNTFAVITNPSCADRSSWSCRHEPGGPTCCPTSVAYCKASKYWWQPFV